MAVTASEDNTAWAVRSQAYPDNVAGCLVGSSVELFHLDVELEFSQN